MFRARRLFVFALALCLTLPLTAAPEPVWLTQTDAEFATNSTYVKQAKANDSSFAWYLFARANRPVGKPAKGSSVKAPRHWEQWATNSQTFPRSGAPKVWTAVKGTIPNEPTSPTLLDLKQGNAAGVTTPGEFKTDNEETQLNLGAVVEEVRRNRDSYEHIRTKGYFCADIVVDFPVEPFPVGALEVKAEWRPKQRSDKDKFYTATFKGKPYVLIGFHIMSKALPQWFWATWEHESNPMRGRLFASQHDTFGFKNNKPTKALTGIFKAAGMDADLWSHYRVVNWQIAPDNPTVAGNSVIEGVLTPGSSSCITCHALASANKIAKTKVGNVNFPALTQTVPKTTKVFDNVTPVGAKKPKKTVSLDFTNTGYVGTPPSTTTTVTTNKDGTVSKTTNILADFNTFDAVWSLFRADQNATPACNAIRKGREKEKPFDERQNKTSPRRSHGPALSH